MDKINAFREMTLVVIIITAVLSGTVTILSTPSSSSSANAITKGTVDDPTQGMSLITGSSLCIANCTNALPSGGLQASSSEDRGEPQEPPEPPEDQDTGSTLRVIELTFD